MKKTRPTNTGISSNGKHYSTIWRGIIIEKAVQLIRTIDNNLRTVPLVMLLIINSLYVLKYGARVTNHYWILVPAYILFVVLSMWTLNHFSKKITKAPVIFFCGLCLFFLVGFLLVLGRIDPLTVQVDRWSAITSFNDALLAGEYPYAARTHLDHAVSSFPCLFLLAMPFQLLGDVGYLQLFGFLCFGFLAYKCYTGLNHRTISLFLLGTSPIFLSEVAIRSELFSNMIIVLLLLFGCEFFRQKKNCQNMILCGTAAGLVLSTRGIVLIPFILYFAGYFKKNELLYAAVFVLSSIVTFGLTLLPFYLREKVLFMENNPFILQSSYIPEVLLAVVIIVSVIVGLRTRQFGDFLLSTGYIIFTTVLIVFLLAVAGFGWCQVVYQSYFDISYFEFSVPFLLLGLFGE